MIAECVILLLTNAILYVVARMVSDADWGTRGGEVPVWVSVPLSLWGFFAVSYASRLLMDAAGEGYGLPIVMAVFVVSTFFPAVVYVHMISDGIIGGSINGMYGWDSSACVVESDHSRAKTLARRKDTTGAVQAYRDYHQKAPGIPKPLFSAATLLEAECEYHEAATLLREIMVKFGKQDTVWAEAAYRLANLQEHLMRDTSSARILLEEVARRSPGSSTGRLARERLTEMKVAG